MVPTTLTSRYQVSDGLQSTIQYNEKYINNTQVSSAAHRKARFRTYEVHKTIYNSKMFTPSSAHVTLQRSAVQRSATACAVL